MFIKGLRKFSAIFWLIRIILIFPEVKNRLKVFSISSALVSSSTTKKFVPFLFVLFPIPARRNPVTVSLSPMIATND